MALTGRKKYLVRMMINSGDNKNIIIAKSVLKASGYSDREIDAWIDSSNKVKEHNRKAEATKQFKELFSPTKQDGMIINRGWPDIPIGIEAAKLFDDLMEREVGKFLDGMKK